MEALKKEFFTHHASRLWGHKRRHTVLTCVSTGHYSYKKLIEPHLKDHKSLSTACRQVAIQKIEQELYLVIFAGTNRYYDEA